MKTERLAHRIADQISEMIVSDHMHPGDRLPTENELMARYNVGRSTIREAVKRLQAENIVYIRHGSGSFVADNTGVAKDPLGFTFRDRKTLLPELMEIRILLEPGIAELAAERRAGKDLQAMAEANQAMADAAGSGADYEEFDGRFHKALAESTHNSMLRRIYPLILEGVEEGYGQTAHVTGSVDTALAFHRAILKAVEEKDGPRARELTEKHLRQTMQDIDAKTKGELS